MKNRNYVKKLAIGVEKRLERYQQAKNWNFYAALYQFFIQKFGPGYEF